MALHLNHCARIKARPHTGSSAPTLSGTELSQLPVAESPEGFNIGKLMMVKIATLFVIGVWVLQNLESSHGQKLLTLLEAPICKTA